MLSALADRMEVEARGDPPVSLFVYDGDTGDLCAVVGEDES